MLVIHNTYNKTAISFIHKSNHLIIADSAQIKFINKASGNMNTAFRIKGVILLPLPVNEQIHDTMVCGIKIHSFMGRNLLLETNIKRIIVIRDPKILQYKCSKPQMADLVIFNGVNDKTCGKTLNYFTAKEIIYYHKERNLHKVKKAYAHYNFIEKVGSIKIDL